MEDGPRRTEDAEDTETDSTPMFQGNGARKGIYFVRLSSVKTAIRDAVQGRV
jgi:hypothetical protein